VELFTSDSDAWDDSALVQAWDATMESFKKELFNADPEEETVEQDKTKRKRRNRKKKSRAQNMNAGVMMDWTVGDECEARYSGDGLYYQAEIVALAETFATVLFIEYDDEVDVMLSDLRSQNVSQKPESDTQSRKGNGYVPRPPAWSHTTVPTPALPQHYATPPMPQHYPPVPHMAFPSMPPPPPPCPVHHFPKPTHTHGPMPQPPCPTHPFRDNNCTDEALASMLMSWYKTGYSTGYYQALREHGITPSTQSEGSNKVQ